MDLIVVIGIALLNFKLWQLVIEQRRHNVAVESLLATPKGNLNPTH
jgi:hypothetical protein